MTTLIGDVHGKYRQYREIIRDKRDTIQLGDMGVGFKKISAAPDAWEWLPNPPYDAMFAGNHRFIRGNHDNPQVCARHNQWIPDGTVENDVMFIGGGLSIDKHLRLEGYSWWPDEELSQAEWEPVVDKYLAVKPRIMLTHECPEQAAAHLFGVLTSQGYKLEWPSITRQAFQAMWDGHEPELWVFGHWHQSKDAKMRGTRFVCLNELETMEI